MQQRITTDAAREFQRRHDAVLAALREEGRPQLVVTSTEALFYFTGATIEALERPFFLVLDADTGGRHFLVPELERTHVLGFWGTDKQQVLAYREFPAPVGEAWHDVLAPLLKHEFTYEPSTPAYIASVFDALGGSHADVLRPVRLVKSDYEVAQVAIAADYARRGVEKLLAATYPGTSVIEGYMTSNAIQRAVIAEQQIFNPLASSITVAAWPAPVSSEPHSVPPLAATLDGGPHVVMALTRVNGYAAECERTFFTHAPTPDERDLFAAMLGARALAYSMVLPGVHAAEIDEAVNAYLAVLGYDDHQQRMHRTGHGFGLSAHEPPWIAVGSDDVLAPNMLISIEPAVYVEGIGGYRHSDTVLVTQDGYRSLSPTADDIDSLTLTTSNRFRRTKGALVRRVAGVR
ncbi:putative dipeptidase PepE [Streptomyces humidus]|uniref:Dipeptidase PepE n=1 Tax=Streptomyces humidus TaxID=52259 RepID=A0A918GFB1_9ACTN|nr:Xaa-Pro peptidase family protein [Streptomyces humidus]GGS32759.1 putative dipeptidase PepE [Streptomyces humidus]